MQTVTFRFERKDDPGVLAHEVADGLMKLGLVVEMTKDNEEIIEFIVRREEQSPR